MPELEIVIDEQGNVQIDVKGAKGKQCLDLTKDIEQMLGVVLERKKKPEWNVQTLEVMHGYCG